MGMHPKGKLFYGYNLGSDDDGWSGLAEAQVSESNPFGCLKTPWYDAEAEADNDPVVGEPLGVAGLMVKVLYEAIPDAAPIKYDFEREAPVKAHYGVWVESHAHCDYPAYVLTAHEITADQGDADLLDLTELAAMPGRGDWDARLARALDVLQVTPVQERPGWLLATDWG